MKYVNKDMKRETSTSSQYQINFKFGTYFFKSFTSQSICPVKTAVEKCQQQITKKKNRTKILPQTASK